MPVLAPEPLVFPDDLFARPDGIWWVLHTKPRAEKALARKMLDRGVGHFLPTYAGKAGRLPLFPGYVFLRGDADDRLAALETNLIANCLAVADQGRFRADLERVWRVADGEAGGLRPEDRLAPGAPVEVVAGPLAGTRGVVVRRGKKLRFVVEVQFLRRGVSIEVDPGDIRPV